VEAWLAQGKLGLAEYANVWGLILVFFRGFLFYLVWLGPVRQALVGVLPGLPVGAWRGLGWGFWIVPAMGFAALLEIAAKDHLWPWILGVATLSAAGVWVFAPQGLPWILSAALLLGVATAWRKKPW
jgi:mannose/fructose/N-acetylgalactosamine-specific phosphotransferase system component IIC